MVAPPEECQLNACRICTDCYHGHPGRCRGTVRCPTDLKVRPCVGAPALVHP
jgi:hypothetical protein